MKTLFLGLLSVLIVFLSNNGANALETPDHRSFSDRAVVGSETLILNGVGTRTATLFAIKVYHAAFYANRPTPTAVEAIAAPNPKRLDIRYLRVFDLEGTKEGWSYQFHESGGITGTTLAQEMHTLLSYQREIRKGDVHRFDLEDGKTSFYIGDEKRGEIPGKEFQDALLKIFFGKNPPTKDLQRGLLGLKNKRGTICQ